MRLSNALTLIFVASAVFVSFFMTAQEAAASNDRIFALGRGTDSEEFGLFAHQTTLLDMAFDPFSAAVVGTTQDVPLNGLAFQPGTGTLYVSSSQKGTDGLNGGPGFRSLYTMDPVTAETTLVGSFGFGSIMDDGTLLRTLAFDAGGTLYGTSLEQLFSIDITTGLASAVGSPYLGAGGAAIESIAIDPTSGTLYGLSWNDMELFAIDKTTGEATSEGVFLGLDTALPGLAIAALAIDSQGNMYASTGSKQARLFSIDKSDFSHVELGDANDFIGTEVFNGSLSALAFGPASTELTADFDSDGDVDGADFLEWQRDSVNLGASGLADWEDQFGAISANAVISAVPEPSALALLMLGAIGWVSSRKARHDSAFRG